MLVDQWPIGVITSTSIDYSYSNIITKFDNSLNRVRILQETPERTRNWYSFYPRAELCLGFGIRFKGYVSIESLLTSNSEKVRIFITEYLQSEKYRMRNFDKFVERSTRKLEKEIKEKGLKVDH